MFLLFPSKKKNVSTKKVFEIKTKKQYQTAPKFAHHAHQVQVKTHKLDSNGNQLHHGPGPSSTCLLQALDPLLLLQ